MQLIDGIQIGVSITGHRSFLMLSWSETLKILPRCFQSQVKLYHTDPIQSSVNHSNINRVRHAENQAVSIFTNLYVKTCDSKTS